MADRGGNKTRGQAVILVVEDEASISEILALYLRRAGYDVLTAAGGHAAMETLETAPPDLVILDLMLPDLDGFEILRHLRSRGDTPVIVLTARGSEPDRIAGLEMGADDYVVKPFSPQEVVSRVRAVLRRSTARKEQPKEESRLAFDGISIDPKARVVEVDGEEKSLTAREFDLLLVMARRPRQVFKRDQLLDLVWGFSDYIDPSTVTVHIRRLREKIEADPARPRHISTVWGVGYRFEP